MAFLDDPDFIIAHIRHSCVTSDDTGMCEQVIVNEEYENEKVMKHRKKFGGQYLYPRDSTSGFPEMNSYPQSFDIAVSPDMMSIRNSKSQGKGDRSRRDKNNDAKCKVVSWKERSDTMTSKEMGSVFSKRAVKQIKTSKTSSMLSKQLSEARGLINNPFLEYAKFEGEAYQGTCSTKKLKIFLTMLSKEDSQIPMSVIVLGTACVQDLIGLILYKYTLQDLVPPIKGDVKSYCLYIAEDDGEVDVDFPALENEEPIIKFHFTSLALAEDHEMVDAESLPSPQKSTPDISVKVNEQGHGFSRLKVDNMSIKMKDVYDRIVKKRGLRRTAHEYILEKQSEPSVSVDLNATLESMGTTEFCLVRKGRDKMEVGEDFPPTYQYKSYRVFMIHKLRTLTEIQLGVSVERIEIDPVPQPKSAKFWAKQKAVSLDMDNVVHCDSMDGKSNGKSTFRIVFFSTTTRDFKHYDFEADTKTANEIGKKINQIFKLSSVSSRRAEYQTQRERKAERRRSFR